MKIEEECKIIYDSMGLISNDYDVIITEGIVHLLRSRHICESCHYWAPVYCLENKQEKIQTIFGVSKGIHDFLDVIPTLKWGKDKNNVTRLFNHCEKCSTAFVDDELFRRGEAFTPVHDSQCEEMLIIELPIMKPQKIIGLRPCYSNTVHLDHAKRLSWKKFIKEPQK